jgi:hypothetical protein
MTKDSGSFAKKLKQKEKAEENVFFGRRDRDLLERIRHARDDTLREEIKELTHMRCPECGALLQQTEHHDVTIEQCPEGHGLWLTESQMHALARRERDSWIGRYLYRPRLVKSGLVK